MAFDIAENIQVIQDAIEDRFIEYFSQRNVDITDIQTSYQIKQVTYNAAWRYCYKELFKPDKPQLNNRNSKINYDDIKQLDAICDAYLDICFEYHVEPNYFGFCRLTGISRETIDRWKNTEVQSRANKPWYDMVKRIYIASQSYTRAELENTPVGQITKANNDEEKGLLYSRQQAQAMISAAQLETPEQISARHQSAMIPEKPRLDE